MARKNVLDIPVSELSEDDIIYDWNELSPTPPPKRISFFDETLRDGIQSPSVVDPPIEEKLRIVHLMDDVGIQYADIGLPGAGPRAYEDTRAVIKEIRDSKLALEPAAAGRTVLADIQPIVDISQELGVPIEVMAFIGSSTIRLYAEHWDLGRMLKLSADAIKLCKQYNLPACYVTEDTTRSHPEVLRALFLNAIEHGADRLCLCDTVGHATPDGVRSLIQWTQALLDEVGAKDVLIDWHGHDDRGLGVVNAIFAAEYGAERVHGTCLGIGERVGNAALDQVLLNMKLLGWIDNDLSKLVQYGLTVSAATRVPIPCNYPLVGTDAFRTGTGVHAAAVIKAERRGDAFLADRIYSGVPASMFGKQQEIEIGHMSGESNVIYWLDKRGIAADDKLVARIFAEAKATNRVLRDDEIWQVINEHRKEEQL
ncbi:MAG: 2-isopropylmalate synthase [Myxococcales bacterium]|nr:2-isopropylmalate synthase [Myxococcales bacterium]